MVFLPLTLMKPNTAGRQAGRGRAGPAWESPLTLADAGVLTEVIPSRALALEAAEGVDTVTSPAQPWQLLALIDVCREVRGAECGAESLQKTQATLGSLCSPEYSQAL